jgi:tetratricopeptide (TPR) repeat protein
MTTPIPNLDLALELIEKRNFKEAEAVLLNILDHDTQNPHSVYIVLGNLYRDMGEKQKAMENFMKATRLQPKSELASLGLYIIYHELDRDMEAMEELFRYLKSYPADLFKDTLTELLEGLEHGFMTCYKKEIHEFASLNGVEK